MKLMYYDSGKSTRYISFYTTFNLYEVANLENLLIWRLDAKKAYINLQARIKMLDSHLSHGTIPSGLRKKKVQAKRTKRGYT